MGTTTEVREEFRNHAQKKGVPVPQKAAGLDFPLLISDFILAFMWVWSGPLINIFVHNVLGLKNDSTSEILRYVLSIANMFFFAICLNVSKGGAYNPLNVLGTAISGDFGQLLFTVGCRIPAQVFGSIVGVRLLIASIPGIGKGPRLAVDIHHGALIEGILTYMIVSISLGLSKSLESDSFYRKTWISSVSKLTLHILGSDLTGGVMNPASVTGWAYARGDHVTKEHLLVYWLAPVQATLLAIWTSKFFYRAKDKSD